MTAALQAYSTISSGKAQASAYKAQAKQAESDAKTQTIERKRALIETLAMQNVGAAAQGRTIASVANLQSEDVRRGKYDTTLIQGGASAKASALAAAGKSAKNSAYLNAGIGLLKSGQDAAKLM